MFRNVASKFMVFAFDATTNVPKTGDAANITAYVSKDYGTVTVLADTSATEMDATNAPGYYLFDAAQGETNGDCLLVSGKSSTSNIKIIGAPAVIYTRPTTGWLAPATAGRTLVVDANGLADANMVKAGPTGAGTAQTTGDIPGKTNSLTFTGANKVDASVRDWLGTAPLTPNTAGVPLVDNRGTTMRVGTAQAGNSVSITLDAGANATNDYYTRYNISIISGTGAAQTGRLITAYNGSTKVASITPDWTTNPDNTSVFVLMPATTEVQMWKSSSCPQPSVSGVPIIDQKYFLGTAITDTAGQVAAAFSQFFNVPSPTGTMKAITAVGTVTTLTNLPAITANWLTAAGTAADFGAEVADAYLDRDMSIGTDSSSDTVRTVRSALRQIRNKFSISGSTITYTKENDATTSHTGTLSTDAAAVPITGYDPAGP